MTHITWRRDVLPNDDSGIYRLIYERETMAINEHGIWEDEHGTYRWCPDSTMRWLVDSPAFDLNAHLDHIGHDKNNWNWRDMYRNIGYSLHGYWEIFYWEVNNEDWESYNETESWKRSLQK